MQSRLLSCALTFGLVIGSVASCRTSASAKGDQAGPAVRPPFVAAEPPLEASRSKWVNENWKLYKTALAKAGLALVPLDAWYPQQERMDDRNAPWHNLDPKDPCKLLENLPGAPPRLLYNPSDRFGVSADGKIYCLVLQDQELDKKKESVQGTPPNCMGGAYRRVEVNYHLYSLSEGVPVGGVRMVRVPYHPLDIHYSEQCPLVPSAHH